MALLSVAGAAWILTHLGLSSTAARAGLVGALGERGYLAVYSLVAIATLVWLIMVYNRVPHAEFLWVPGAGLRTLAMVLMAFALILLLGGFMARNPTAVGQESQVGAAGEGSGLVRITRHPFQWSVVLWSASHILANGDLASLVFFASIGIVALAGTVLIDRKKAASLGADWVPFARATSNVPFAAIVAGRNRLVAAELWLPVLVGLIVYALVLWQHRWVSGVSLF